MTIVRRRSCWPPIVLGAAAAPAREDARPGCNKPSRAQRKPRARR